MVDRTPFDTEINTSAIHCNQKFECTSYISSTSTDNHDVEYQPTSSKLQRRSEPTLLSPRNITLPLASIGGSHSTCFVCKTRVPKLIVASASVRFNCFLYNNIIVPAGSRCCPSHVNDGDLLTRQYIWCQTVDQIQILIESKSLICLTKYGKLF
jgi:hypothetical protein